MAKTPTQIQQEIDATYVSNDTGNIHATDAHETFSDITELLAQTINEGNVTNLASAYFSIINQTTNAPPISPTLGDAYVVGTSPTGTWTGKAKDVAVWDGGQWLFAIPKTGYKIYDQSTTHTYTYTGGAWVLDSVQGVTIHAQLLGLTADDHPQYLTNARGDARYDALGQAAGLMSAHLAAPDPHPQYLLPAEGDAAYIHQAAIPFLKQADSGAPNGLVFTDSPSIMADYSIPGQVSLTVQAQGTTNTDYEESVRVAIDSTTAHSGLQTIQGYTLLDGDRVLDTVAGTEARIFLARSGAWDYADGWSNTDTVTSGKVVPIEIGTYQGKIFLLITHDPIVLGTTSLSWSQTQQFVSNFVTSFLNSTAVVTAATSGKNWILLNKNGAQSFTLRSFTLAPLPVGTEIIIQAYGSGNKTIVAANGVKLNGTNAGSIVLVNKWDALWLKVVRKNEWTAAKMIAGGSTSVSDGDYGDIVISGGVWTIDAKVVTFSNMADLTGAGFIGNVAAGPPGLITPTVAKTMLNLSGTNTGDQAAFTAVHVATQTNVTAGGPGSTLTFVAGPNMSIATDAGSNSVIFSAPTESYTNAQAVAAVAAAFAAGTQNGLSISYNSGTPSFSYTVPVMVGDTGSGGVKGLVGAPGVGDAGKYWRGDASWGVPSGTGAPSDADYLVKTANGSLSAERVVTDTATISWDWTTSGQAKANLVSTYLVASNNLSDLTNAGTARTNLGLGTAALLASDTDTSLSANSDSRLATQKAVKAYVDAVVAVADALVYKGAIDCSANPNYPAADAGWFYKVSVAGKIGGASGVNVEVGDSLICTLDGSPSGNQATVGANWDILQTNIDGAVIGPSSVTDGNLAAFNGATGKLIKELTPSAVRTLLSLVIGTNVQAWDADLDTIAGLTATTDSFMQAKAGAWAARTIAQVKTDLGISGTNTGDQTITLTGDVTGSGTGSFAATLATVNSNTGTWGDSTHIPSFTVNGKGLITAASQTAISASGLGALTAANNLSDVADAPTARVNLGVAIFQHSFQGGL